MPKPTANPSDTWHVYTDGSARHERRQTFTGWAARAVQPETRQVRQVSGAQPGGDSLSAERSAILEGLRLVPPRATAHLHCDLELPAILSALHGPAGEAARAHLHAVLVHPVLRNRNAHQRDMHRVSRAMEHDVRAGDHGDGAGLTNAAQEAQLTARAASHTPPELRDARRALPGLASTPQAHVQSVTVTDVSGEEQQARFVATLDLALSGVQAAGRSEPEAARQALRRALIALHALGPLDVHVPADLAAFAESVTDELSGVRVVLPAPPDDQR